MIVSQWKKSLWTMIEREADQIIHLAEEWKHFSELGFAEFETSKQLVRYLEDIPALEVTKGIAVTGVCARLKNPRRPGPCIGFTADMDGLKNGHLCGHYMQTSTLAVTAKFLANSGIIHAVGGEIRFLACPAEEFEDNEYRKKLLCAKRIESISGKVDFIKRGLFSGLDAVVSVHLADHLPDRKVIVGAQGEGFWRLHIMCEEKGSRFHIGYRLRKLLSAWIRQWESERKQRIFMKEGEDTGPVTCTLYVFYTFCDEMEQMELQKNVEQMLQMEHIQVHTKIEPGYQPFLQNETLTKLIVQQGIELLGEDAILYQNKVFGATDLGNVSQMIPTVQPLIGGTFGETHSPSFRVVDPWMAYVFPVKLMTGVIIELLLAKELDENYTTM